MRNQNFLSFLLAALLALPTLAKAGALVEGDGNDAYIDQIAVNDGNYGHLYDYFVGGLFTPRGVSAVMVEPFALPYLAPGQQVTGATISFYEEQPNGAENYNLQLYGLNRVSATSSAVLQSDYYAGGANDGANTLLDAKFATPATPINAMVSYSGGNLASFIQQQYANPAFSGLDMSATRFVFFRLSADSTSMNNDYVFANARNPNRAVHPTLALTISNGITNIAGRLQFSFNLPKTSITSAGVYNSSTGTLIRTLWNNQQFQQGTNYGSWDGNDDNGNAVATGTSYKIKLIYHNVQYVFEGMVGNTSASQSGVNVYHNFAKMVDMAIGGGNAYFTVGYNEGTNPYHYFALGTPQVPVNMIATGFSDVNSAITMVTTDGTRTYWTKGYGGMTGIDTYVVAFASTSGNSYVFPNGTNPPGGNPSGAYLSCIDFDTTANQPNGATGIAVQKTGNYLFVAHGNLNTVRVFDKVQGNLVSSFSVTNPGRMATTANGDVWIISNATPPVVQRYTFANGTATMDKTISGLSAPAGLGISADDSLLLVADGGTSQQIKAYTNSTGTSAWTYGTPGGMPAAGPTINTNTFCFNTQWNNFNTFTNEAFIAFLPDNTFWMSDGGNGRVLHYSINGNSLAYIEQIAYMDVSYRATVDVSDATRVFNNFMEYSVNYSLPLGGTNGSWKLVNNWAYGLPKDSTHFYIGYANGPENVVTLPNGRTYAFLHNYSAGSEDLFELPPTGPARPTGYAYFNSPRMYPDGSLRFNVTGTSSLSFYSQPLTGFDSKNNPVWGSPSLIASTTLAATDPQTNDSYPERTEVTATGVVVNYDPMHEDSGYHLGGIAKGGSSWLWRSSPSVNGWYWYPQDGRFDTGDSVQYAGNFDMALGRNIVCGYHGELWKGGQASHWLNFFDNGLLVGMFGTYETLSNMGANTVDGYAGNSYSPTLVNGPNGKVYLYHNDESNHGGTCRWRIDGWDGIAEISGSGSIGGTASLSASTGPSVSITSPGQGTPYLSGNNLTFSAEAAGSSGAIASVQFLDGTTSLGTVTSAPYNLTFSGLSAGSHSITAVATDVNGLTGTSAAVSITVGSEGSSTPPAAPTSLSSGTLTSASVPLSWTEPATSGTSTAAGQILSFQCDNAGDSNALSPSTIAGAPGYAVAHFNMLGTGQTGGLTFINPISSIGTIVPNIGLTAGMSGSTSGNSILSLLGVTKQLFSSEIQTWSAHSIAVSNIPYAQYDLVVYSMPSGISVGTQTASVIVNDNVNTTTVSQSFTALPLTYTTASVAFGSNASVSNANTVVITGLTSPTVYLQGGNIAAFQIVERPLDQGVPASYTIQRAASNGVFSTVGTATGSATSYTDTTVSSGTAYQYRVMATNSFGSSAYSSVASVTTPGTVTSSPTPPTPTPPTTTNTVGFSSWQSTYFTAAQITDATISGPTADPYGSGVSNLMAYALQLNPASAKPSQVPSAVVVNGHLQITYLVPTAITDINYIIEVSTDLETWNTGTGYTHVVSTVPGSGGTTITVQDTLPTTAPKHFMRLRVTQQ
jgi:hypothetical protein